MLNIDHKAVDFALIGVPTKKDPETGKQLYKHHPMFEVISLLFPIVGMDSITDDNWREFWTRVRMSECVHGRFLRDRDMRPEDVRAYIGLRANVTPLSRARYRTQIEKALREVLDREFRAWEKKGGWDAA